MIGFTFSAEQVRSAPPDVRRWMENEIATALGLRAAEAERPKPAAPALAACSPDAAAQILSLVGTGTLAGRLFLEFGGETAECPGTALRALSVQDLMQRTGPAHGEQLIECLYAINEAFQRLRNDPSATLFGFDQSGHVYVHETTHRSIRQLLEQIAAVHHAGAAPPAERDAEFRGAVPAGFTLPHLGPSEDLPHHYAASTPGTYPGWTGAKP